MAGESVVEGVILRRWTVGEADKRVSLLTPDRGKLSLRVRGTQKPGSRMGMLTEPLNRVRGRVIEGRHQRLLVQPQLVRTYLHLRGDLERLSVALALTEMVDRWLAEEHPEPQVYAILVEALDALEKGCDVATILGWVVWRMLAILGYSPELNRCGRCGRSPSEGAEWHLLGGVGFCPECKPPTTVMIEQKAVRSPTLLTLTASQRTLLSRWLEQEEPPQAEEPEARALVRIALRYSESALETEPRWLAFWDRLNSLRDGA